MIRDVGAYAGRLFDPLPTMRPSILGTHYVVASGHYLASVAGLRILEAGGNVVDAGVTVGLCINVLQPDMTGLAGVAPIILKLAGMPDVATISGLGRWPNQMPLEEFRRRNCELLGATAAVVPSALDAWVEALDRYGTMRFADVVAPAIHLAEQGFLVTRFLHDNLRNFSATLAQWPASRDVFLSQGRPPRPGERLVQRDLALTLRKLVEAEGTTGSRHDGLRAVRARFYKGDIAADMVAGNQQMGGFLTLEDLATFNVKIEPPEKTTYRGLEVYSCGPWCQGPVVLETLNILEGYDLVANPQHSAAVLHVVTEALKAAFADRHAYYGDPEFLGVPMRGLLSKEYAGEWRERIDRTRATPAMPEPGDPWRYDVEHTRRYSAPPLAPTSGPEVFDTSYVCVVDAQGNAFSATPSDGVVEAPLVPGLGMIISPRGRQFWRDARHPSCLAPGKRPRLSPSPGLVLRDGRVVMAYGSPGLDVQPQAMVQLILGVFDYGLDVQEAIEAPRLATFSFPLSTDPHAYAPGLLRVENRVPEETREALTGMGHQVETWPAWTPTAGALCAILVDQKDPGLAGGADPRRVAYAVGW